MIVSLIKRGVLSNYQLGGRSIPEGILLPKDIELIWNETKWEVYKVQKGAIASVDTLTWQMSLPFRELTPSAVKNYLQKYDTSEGGALDAERRQKDWKSMFAKTIEYSNKRKDALREQCMYEVGHMSRWLGRYEEGLKQCVVPVDCGTRNVEGKMKRVWAYRKTARKNRRLVT